jgi:cell wall assembly regulator SMI1
MLPEDIRELTEEFRSNGRLDVSAVEQVENVLSFAFPKDYREFIAETDGGEGFVGNGFLRLWRLEELIPFNQDYEVDEYAPGIFMFGSNGTNEGFGYDIRRSEFSVVQVPFIGMDLDSAIKVADNFTHLLRRIHSCDGSLLST